LLRKPVEKPARNEMHLTVNLNATLIALINRRRQDSSQLSLLKGVCCKMKTGITTNSNVILFFRQVPVFAWELREFSNFAKTRVRMLSFHMFHFTMLFTSGRTCCDNILLCINTKLIFLNLNPSARQILFFLFPISQFWSDSIIITTALKD